jgi:protein-tyrosine phosphatase
MKTVLFLCTGNYYRSRFAEHFFNWHARQRGVAWTAESRGLALDPSNPGPISLHTVLRLRDLGIPLNGDTRRPLPVSRQDFEAAHHVVAVKEIEHRPMIERRFPTWLERVEFWKVDDLDCAGPEEAFPHLEREVIGLMERLSGRSNEEARNPNDEGNPKH